MKPLSAFRPFGILVAVALPTLTLAQQPLAPPWEAELAFAFASLSTPRPAASSAAPAADATTDLSGPSTRNASATRSVTPPAPVSKEPLTARWLDLKTLAHAERYRNAFDQNGYHVYADGQQHSIVEGRLKLDAEARYTVGFRASSGRYFNWAFADYAGAGISERTGPNSAAQASHTPAEGQEIYQALLADPVGAITYSRLPSNGWEFYTRELFLSATPIKPITFEFGSFAIERGRSSEITTFDDDGYISGERLRLHNPDRLYFTEVAFTNAFLGSVGDPNLFSRGLSLGSSNYRQLLVAKDLNARVRYSADYTWLIGTNTLREAAEVNTGELKAVDSFRFEAYQRLNGIELQGLETAGGAGFAVAARKKLAPRIDLEAGFASVDKDYTAYNGSRFAHSIGFSLNGDSYSMGKRPFFRTNVQLTRQINAFGFYTHEVGPRTNNLDQQNLNAGLNLDLKACLNAKRLVF